MNNKTLLIKIPQWGMITFILCIIFGMLLYPGGTEENSEKYQFNSIQNNQFSEGYSLANNFLSDLGRYEAHNGQNNLYSFLLFNTALIIVGFVICIFFLHVRSLFNLELGFPYWISIFGSIFGVAAGYSIMGVALTPADLYIKPHIACAHLFFRFFALSVTCYSIVMFKTKLISKKYALGYCFFACMLLLYILISEIGPTPHHQQSIVLLQFALLLQVVSQKGILLCFFIVLYMQNKGLKSIIE